MNEYVKRARADFQKGTHTPTDTYKIALYKTGTTLPNTIDSYSATGEVTNTGEYVAGGKALSGLVSPVPGDVSFMSWSNVAWTNTTFKDANLPASALLYNATKNAAIAIFTFTADPTEAGTFTLKMPVANTTTALIRMS